MRYPHSLVVIAMSVAFAFALTGCAKPAANPPATPIEATSPSSSAAAPAVTPAMPKTPSVPVTSAPSATTSPAVIPAPAAGKPVSAASRRYAKQLGGLSHRDETLYLIIGGSFKSEAAATKALRNARPYFGDMQDYFIVQHSDNFSGMRPGSWVLIEGYRTEASAKEQLGFAQRAFESTSIKRVVVGTADPIPVYNDLIDYATP